MPLAVSSLYLGRGHCFSIAIPPGFLLCALPSACYAMLAAIRTLVFPPSVPRRVSFCRQGTPIDMPYLKDFPPAAEFPTFEWLGEFAKTLVRTLLGAVRYGIQTRRPATELLCLQLYLVCCRPSLPWGSQHGGSTYIHHPTTETRRSKPYKVSSFCGGTVCRYTDHARYMFLHLPACHEEKVPPVAPYPTKTKYRRAVTPLPADFPTLSHHMRVSHFFCRGTIGVGEVIEAITDPEKAANFATRIDELIGENLTNERVRNNETSSDKTPRLVGFSHVFIWVPGPDLTVRFVIE